MLIFIIGYMCAGKTTIGNQLAARLNFSFLDFDELIEKASGYSISGYFEKYGEMAFREEERRVLLSHLDDNLTVIATGGGTPCYSDNMALMNKKGVTVFIDVSTGTVVERLSGNLAGRPLLKDIPPDKLTGFVSSHLQARREYYNRAKIRVDGESIDLDGIVNAIRLIMQDRKQQPIF